VINVDSRVFEMPFSGDLLGIPSSRKYICLVIYIVESILAVFCENAINCFPEICPLHFCASPSHPVYDVWPLTAIAEENKIIPMANLVAIQIKR